jgi:hypothetical protein
MPQKNGILCYTAVITPKTCTLRLDYSEKPVMLFMEIILLYCENHMEHIHTLCGRTAEFLHVKVGGTYSYHFYFILHIVSTSQATCLHDAAWTVKGKGNAMPLQAWTGP